MEVFKTILNLVGSVLSGLILTRFKKSEEKREKEQEAQKEREIAQKNEIEEIKRQQKEEMNLLRTEINLLKAALQSSLRQDMINLYTVRKEKGYAPLYIKDSFANMYKWYHSLGANGVMDKIYEEFMKLPESPPKTSKIGGET